MATLKTKITADASQFLNVIKEVLKVAQDLGAELQDVTNVGDINIDTSSLEDAISEVDSIDGSSINAEVDVDDSQVEELPQQFEEAGKLSGQNFSKGLKGINLGALAGVGAVAGLGALAIKAGETADRLLDLNNITDISTDTLQEFQFISNQAGVETEALSRGAESLTKRLGAVRTGNEPVVESLKQLGVSFKDANGEIRSTEDVMNESIQALAGLENQTERNQLSSQLFGGAYKDLAPVLGLGADAIKNLREEANELGLVKTNEDLVNANAFRAQLDELKAIAGSIAFDIGTALQPLLSVLIPIVKDLIDLVVKTIKPVIDALTPVLEEIFSAVGDLAGVLGELLADVLGNIAELLAPLGKLLVPIINAVTEVMKELSPIITQVVEIVVELVDTLLVALEPILSVVLDVFVDLIKVALKPLLPLLQALAPIITTFAKVLELVSLIIAPIIGVLGEFIISLFELRNEALEPVIEFIESLVKNLTVLYDTAISFITDIGKSLGLIEDKETEVKIETNAKEVKEEVEDLSNVESPEIEAPIKPVAPPKEEVKKTIADLSNFITDLFTSNSIKINTEFELSTIGIDDALNFFNNGTALTGDKDVLNEINKELERVAELKKTITETDQFIELQIEGKDKIISDLSSVRNENDKILNDLEDRRLDLSQQIAFSSTDKQRNELLKQLDALQDDIIDQTIKTSTKSNLTREELEQASSERIKKLRLDNLEAINSEVLEKEKALNELRADFTSTSERDLQKLRLELAEETNENLKQKEVLEAQERFAELLNKFRDSEEAKLLIKKAYDEELRDIDKKYAVTVTSLYEDLAKTFAISISSYDPQNIIDKNKEVEKSINSVKSEYEKETDVLNEQLKNREISYLEYNTKIVDLENEKNEKLKELESERFDFVDIINDQLTESFKKLADNVKETFEQQSQAVIGYQDKLTDYQKQLEEGVITELEYNELTTQAQKDKEDALTASYEAIAVASGATLASLIADGESFTTALARTALEGLQALVPVFIAEIFGQSLGQLGPIAGPVVAGALTATLQGLISVAQSSIGGANDGVIGLSEGNKGKPKGKDSILMMLAPNESVITSSGTAKNKPYLEFINKGGSIADLINPNVYSSDMGETNSRLMANTKEISELRKDMRKLRVDHFYDKQPKVTLNNNVVIKSQRGVL